MTVLCMLEVVHIGIFLWRVSVILAMFVSLRAEVLGQLDSSKTRRLLPDYKSLLIIGDLNDEKWFCENV